MTDAVDRVTALLREHPLIDGHNDLLWELRKQFGYDLDRAAIDRGLGTTHTDLPRLRAGGLGAQFWSVWVPSDLPAVLAVTGTLEQLDAGRRMVERYADHLGAASMADDVETVFGSGRVASMFGIEGGHSIGCSLGALRMMHALGARYLTLTHNDNTPWADSATDAPGCGGLTAFGSEVVRELNRLGMLVDLSHVATSTMHAALDVTEAPVVFSHSSARALCDHPRNVPDDVLKRVADGAGVVMVAFVPYFLTDDARRWQWERHLLEQELAREHGRDSDAVKERLAAWRVGHPVPVTTVEDIADHVEHVREVAGVDHIGIGGDFDGVEDLPVGMPDVSGYPRLFAELVGRGWSDADLVALAGGNVMRVLRDAEAVARELQTRRDPSLATIGDLDGADPRAAQQQP